LTARIPAVLLLLLFGAAASLRAQESDVQLVLDRLAASWSRGDAAAIAAVSARAGVSLDLDGGAVGPIAQRQAAAMLRRLFDEHATVSLRPGMIQVVGGSPLRAFGEFAWSARAQGTTIPERATIFVALVEEDDGWRITQIRLRK